MCESLVMGKYSLHLAFSPRIIRLCLCIFSRSGKILDIFAWQDVNGIQGSINLLSCIFIFESVLYWGRHGDEKISQLYSQINELDWHFRSNFPWGFLMAHLEKQILVFSSWGHIYLKEIEEMWSKQNSYLSQTEYFLENVKSWKYVWKII